MRWNCFIQPLAFLSALQRINATRFALNGPVVTVTLKDPTTSPKSSSKARPRRPWLDLGSLNPSVVTTIQTQEPPLPNWFPNLSGIRATAGYQWNDNSDIGVQPTWVQALADVDIREGVRLSVQPTYTVKTQETNCLVRLQAKAHDVVAQLAKGKLQAISGTLRLSLPYSQVSAISVSPNFRNKILSCQMEAISGRTKAVLDCNVDDPTLQLVHQLDNRHTIAPLVHILTAKISYQWQALLNGGASVVTTVDPTSHIHVRWTDPSIAGGQWVTDCRLPLEGTTLQALAADVRVRRQFRF